MRVKEGPAPAPSAIVMRREDVFADAAHPAASVARLSPDLAALIRISAAISAVRGLVALETIATISGSSQNRVGKFT